MSSSQQAHSGLNYSPVSIGDWTFYPDLHELRGERESTTLEPRASHLLLLLINSAGQPLSRELLIEQAWSGMVVGDEALTSAINKLRKALGDDRLKPRYIQTIPKMGYRLVAEVSALPQSSSPPSPAGITDSETTRRLPWIAAMVLLAAVSAGLFLWTSQSSRESTGEVVDIPTQITDMATVVVLPFENLSQDPDQEYFTDGITEDIITNLTRFDGIRVLAGTTTFKLRGQNIDYQQLVDEFKISHVLEGSVRKSGDTMRISARLNSAQDGHSLWAERYDKPLSDIFEVQDDVSRNIADALSVQLTEQDKLAFERPTTSNFDAYDLYLQGRRQLDQRTPESNQMALDLYHSAIEIDPNFARAYGAIAVALIRTANSTHADDTAQVKDKALFYARKAVELGKRSQNTYWALGFTHLFRGEIEAAQSAVAESLRIAPNYADGMALMALLKNYLEQPREAIDLIEKAMLLNPGYTWDYPYNLGYAHYLLEDYSTAIDYLTTALERNLNARPPRLILIASYMESGSIDDAEWEIEQILTQYPDYSISFLLQEEPLLDTLRMKRYIDQLRQAGLPD